MNVIFVCTGNTCRSPMAEGFLNAKRLFGINAESRGLMASGERVSEKSVNACLKYGIDISSHISRQFTKEDLSADKIICLSKNHADFLLSLGADKSKISVLGDGICDPYGQTQEVYNECAKDILREIDALVYSGFFTSVKIESASEKDAEDIEETESGIFTHFWKAQSVRETLEHSGLFFLAKESGKTIGHIGLSFICGEGYVLTLAVKKEYRHKNAATLLLNRAVSAAFDEDMDFLSLEVRKSNDDAVRLYERLKFKIEGIRKDFYEDPKEDALIMTRRFKI